MYINGEKIRDISRETGIVDSTLVRKFKELGIYKRVNGIPFTKNQEQKIISLRKRGYGKNVISDILKLPYERVAKFIDENIPNQKVFKVMNRDSGSLYHLNADFFKDIDSENKAYWLGFIFADGSLSKNRLTIRLSANDYSHLLKFKNHIEFEGNIRVEKRDSNFKKLSKSCVIEVNSRQFIRNLSKYVPIGKKFNKIRVPNIEDNLIRHFIRGYFDGDGYVVSTRKHIGFCGNQGFLSDLSEIFLDKSLRDNKEGYISNKNGNYGELNYSKRASRNIMEWLYLDSTIYLKRKYDAFYK